MDSAMALGLWKSSFGPVKMELEGDRLQGVWVYDREGREVIGYFEGELVGNVFQFKWHEPADGTPLKGTGYLEFDVDGRAFAGKWKSNSGDRSGAWNGWRTADTLPKGDGGQRDGGQGAGQGDRGSAEPNDGRPGPAEQAPGPPPDRDYL